MAKKKRTMEHPGFEIMARRVAERHGVGLGRAKAMLAAAAGRMGPAAKKKTRARSGPR